MKENYFYKNKTKAINTAKKMAGKFYEEMIITDLKNRYEQEWRNYDSPEYFDYYEITSTMMPEFIFGRKKYSSKEIILAIAGILLMEDCDYDPSIEYLSMEGLAYTLSCSEILFNNKKETDIKELCNNLIVLIKNSDKITKELKETTLQYIEEFLELIEN